MRAATAALHAERLDHFSSEAVFPALQRSSIPAPDAKGCCGSETDLKRTGSMIGFDGRSKEKKERR